MFESAFLNTLKLDSELVACLASYQGQPAIFSDRAPDEVDRPYIVFRISKFPDSLCIDKFNIYVDFFDYNKSAVTSRVVAERVEFIFDSSLRLQHERYSVIRFYPGSSGFVPDPDPKVIHFNIQLSARAAKSKWASQL